MTCRAAGGKAHRDWCVTPLRRRRRGGCHRVTRLSWVRLKARGGFHQGARLTAASFLDFLLCESCPSQQTDRQTVGETDRQAAHSVEQKHQELSGCHGYTPGVSLLLALCMFFCMHVCMHVRGFTLETKSLVTKRRTVDELFWSGVFWAVIFILRFLCQSNAIK